MKKAIIALALILCTLFTACAPANSVPYKVWADWDEMKEALGDRYLYPTYLPECTETSEDIFLASDYNYYPTNPDGTWSHPLSLNDPDLYFGYGVSYNSNNAEINFSFYVCDYEKRRVASTATSPFGLEIFHEITELVNGTEVNFVTKYVDASFSITSIPEPNRRVVCADFSNNGITYSMSISQYGVDDKYADDVPKEELLKVAKSIIEQGDK